MKTRPPLVVRPLFVSQDTAFAVLGIAPRKFREVLVPMCRGFVVRVGKSALIPVDVAEDKLRSLAAGPEPRRACPVCERRRGPSSPGRCR